MSLGGRDAIFEVNLDVSPNELFGRATVGPQGLTRTASPDRSSVMRVSGRPAGESGTTSSAGAGAWPPARSAGVGMWAPTFVRAIVGAAVPAGRRP